MSGPSSNSPLTYTIGDVARLTGRSTSTVYNKATAMKLDLVSVPSKRRDGEKAKAIKSEDLEKLSLALQNAQRRKPARKRATPVAAPTKDTSASLSVLDETVRTLEVLAEKHEALAQKLREAVEWIKA